MNKKELEKSLTKVRTKTWNHKNGLPENVKVKFISAYEKSENGCLVQKDHVDIYKDDKLIKTIIPELDPYVVVFENYVFVSSDGKFEVFNTITEKSYYQELSFVPFAFKVERDDKTKKTYYKLKVTGEGCYWGFESEILEFKFVFSRNIDPEYTYLDLVLDEFYVRFEKENTNE